MGRTQFSILTDDERGRIMDESFRLLEDTGVEVQGNFIRGKLAKTGARVEQTDRVRLPKQLAKELVGLVPSVQERETLSGQRYKVGEGNRQYSSLVLDPVIVDYEDGPRLPRLSDVSRHARIGDSLRLVNATYKMDQGLEGMSAQQSNVRSLAEFLCNTTRHAKACPADMTSLMLWIEMLEVILGGATFRERPIATFGLHLKSPLRLPAYECDLIEMAVARGISLNGGCCPMAGATSPFTLAGTLVLATAETVFFLAAIQSCGESHPVLAASNMFVFNMKSGNISAGAAETALMDAAYIEMMKKLRVPVNQSIGFCDPGGLGFQSGSEALLCSLATVAAGADSFSGLGTIANADGVSAEKIVMDHDLLEMVERFSGGIRVDDDTLATAAIRGVGPGGNFMDSEHTLACLRSGEHYYGGSFVREAREEATMLQRAHERVEQILSAHKPSIPEERVAAIRCKAEQLEAKIGQKQTV